MFEWFTDNLSIESVCHEFGLREETFQEEVENLKNWLEVQNHLPQNAHSTEMLQKFILGCKCDPVKAKEKLDLFFTVRHHIPHIYNNRDPLNKEILTSNHCCQICLLPGLTSDSARVALVGLTSPDPAMFELSPTLSRIFNLIDLTLVGDQLVHKIYIVVNTSNASFSHVLKLSPKKIKDAVYCIQNVYPYKIQGIIFLNVTPVLRVMIEKILKPLFKRKIAKRIHLYCEGHEGLNEIDPKSILPREYGGEGPSLEELNQVWIDASVKHRDWLITAGTVASDESKRQGKRKSEKGCNIT